MSIPLVIMAAGLSTRYGRLKQLEPIGPGGEAIMDYNVWDAVRAGFGPIVLVVRDQIRDAVRAHHTSIWGGDLDFRYVSQEVEQLPEGFAAPPDRRKPWGTAHAVLCAAEVVNAPFGVCNADDLYGPGSFAQLHAYCARSPMPSDGVMIGYRLGDTLSGSGGVARGICHIGREGLLDHVIEVREIRRRDAWIVGVESDDTPVELNTDNVASMNLWGLGPKLVDGIRRRFLRFLRSWGSNATRELYLSAAVNEQIQSGSARVRVLRANDPWCGLTHAADRTAMEGMLRERIAGGVYPERLSATALEQV